MQQVALKLLKQLSLWCAAEELLRSRIIPSENKYILVLKSKLSNDQK